jgi:hypothetical protein
VRGAPASSRRSRGAGRRRKPDAPVVRRSGARSAFTGRTAGKTHANFLGLDPATSLPWQGFVIRSEAYNPEPGRMRPRQPMTARRSRTHEVDPFDLHTALSGHRTLKRRPTPPSARTIPAIGLRGMALAPVPLTTPACRQRSGDSTHPAESALTNDRHPLAPGVEAGNVPSGKVLTPRSRTPRVADLAGIRRSPRPVLVPNHWQQIMARPHQSNALIREAMRVRLNAGIARALAVPAWLEQVHQHDGGGKL